MKEREPRLPVLIGHVTTYADGTATIDVWCPYCRRYHRHGYDPADKKRLSHRCAHCGDYINSRTFQKLEHQSPFRDGGYFIRPE